MHGIIVDVYSVMTKASSLLSGKNVCLSSCISLIMEATTSLRVSIDVQVSRSLDDWDNGN